MLILTNKLDYFKEVIKIKDMVEPLANSILPSD